MSNEQTKITITNPQKMNAIQKIIFELKELIFIILFILLKDSDDIDNMLLFAVFTIADFLQLIAFLFSP